MKCIGILFFVLASTLSFSQINSLQNASDLAQEKMDQTTGNFKFNPVNFVNPFVGTGGHGHTYPGASAPFGMMQLSPDTRFDGWDGCSGYHYSDSIIWGFSHTHLSGTGVSDYGDLLIVPQNGKPRIDPGYQKENGYGSRFSHSDEQASPGYYAVHLQDGNIDARLTVAERSGFHEYTFNERAGKKFILIDLDHRDKLLTSSIEIVNKQTIIGSRISSAWAKEQHFYFHLELDTPYQKARIIDKDGRNKLLLIFPKQTRQVKLRVGMSSVGEYRAKENLEKEIPDWNFENTKKRVENAWRKELQKILFYSEDENVMYNFYTALYHSFLSPNLFNDVQGSYKGNDYKDHSIEDGGYDHYTVFSLWDTYRATHPLFTLTQVERTNGFINTFLRYYNETGDLPVWELAGNETDCMIGYHSASVIADAYAKGIYNFDAFKAIEAMIKTSNAKEFGKNNYGINGFLSVSEEPESVSKTLEYAYDDFCIAQMISQYTFDNKELFYVNDIDKYNKRSLSFVNLYDPSTKFMRGRRSGQWHAPFDPAEVNFNYTEANSWQYSLYAPHAIGVLRDLIGGKDSLEQWLDRLFTTDMNLSGRHQVDITGLIGQYAHGNEPSHHMAYLYNYTNAPEKTQEYVSRIQNEMYSNTPDGLSGNEDCGQMSSWYVLSALGIYQIAPGRPVYELGRPLLDDAIIQFESGKKLRIKTIRNSNENIYIQSVRLNGKELKQHFITHNDLIYGGELVFVMGPEPDEGRKQYDHAPTLSALTDNFVPAPFITQEERIFEDSLTIALGINYPKRFKIYYTTDGSNPEESNSAKEYSSPIIIDQTTIVRAFAKNSEFSSSQIENTFVKKDTNVSIEIKSEYANQYAAYGDFTLIDGLRGGNEYRTGDWQGYWDQHFEAIVTFEDPMELNELGIGFLSDMKSWIFLPEDVTIDITYANGTKDTRTQSIETEPESSMYPHTKDISFNLDSVRKVKQIVVKASPTNVCPEWHLGAGNATWIFTDEIFYK